MAAWYLAAEGRVADSPVVDDRLIGGAVLMRGVEGVDHRLEVMLTAPPPDDQGVESLGGEALQHVLRQRFVCGLAKVDVAESEPYVFRRGAERQGRHHEDELAVVALQALCDVLAESGDHPGVKISGQVRSLLLRASQGDEDRAHLGR